MEGRFWEGFQGESWLSTSLLPNGAGEREKPSVGCARLSRSKKGVSSGRCEDSSLANVRACGWLLSMPESAGSTTGPSDIDPRLSGQGVRSGLADSPKREVFPLLLLPGVPLAWSGKPRVSKGLAQCCALQLPHPPPEGPDDGGPIRSFMNSVLALIVCLICGPLFCTICHSQPTGIVDFI